MEGTQELLKIVEDLFENEKYDEIIELLSDELLSKQNNSDLYAWAAFVNIRLRKFQEALYLAEKSISIDPDNSFGYLQRGGVYRETNRIDDALIDASKAIELNSNNFYAYNLRGLIYLKKGDSNKAIIDYNKSIELKTDYAFAYINRGILFTVLKKFDKAIEDYDKAIELKPKLAISYNNKGSLYFRNGDYNNAIFNYKEAIRLDDTYKFLEDKIKLAQEKIDEKMSIESTIGNIDIIEKNKLENEIEQIIDLIREAAKSQVKMVTHYTKLSVADIYVKDEHVKMHYSNAIYMNDPMEGKVFFDYLDNEEITKAYVSGEKRTETSVYLGSFLPAEDNDGEVSHEDELVMWRTYGKDENGKEASGCNVVISSDFFKLNSSVGEESISMSDNEEELLNVVYIKKLKSSKEIANDNKDKIEPAIAQLKDNLLKLIELRDKYQKRDDFYKEIENSIFKRLSTISYLFKSADYNYEHEVRVITYIPRNSDNIKFREIDEPNLPSKKFYIESYNDILPHIKKIYLGPKVEHYQRWSLYLDYEIRQRVKDGMVSVNPSNIEIIKSECKFQ